MDFSRRDLTGIALFLVPVLCALFLMSSVDLVVTRDDTSLGIFTAGIKYEAISARVAATMYHFAISLAVLAFVCLGTLVICADCLKAYWPRISQVERRWVAFGAVAAIILPLLLIAISHITAKCPGGKAGIDDCLGSMLLNQTIRDGFTQTLGTKAPIFVAGQDSNYMAFVVLLTYFIGALTCATAASAKLPDDKDARAAEVTERARSLTSVLFAMAIVMATSVIAMKLRFDLGLATLTIPTDAKPNPAYLNYQMISSALTTTWAWFLSIYLAVMYFPSRAVLHRNASLVESRDAPWLFIEQSQLIKILRVAALLAPPIVAKAIEVASA